MAHLKPNFVFYFRSEQQVVFDLISWKDNQATNWKNLKVRFWNTVCITLWFKIFRTPHNVTRKSTTRQIFNNFFWKLSTFYLFFENMAAPAMRFFVKKWFWKKVRSKNYFLTHFTSKDVIFWFFRGCCWKTQFCCIKSLEKPEYIFQKVFNTWEFEPKILQCVKFQTKTLYRMLVFGPRTIVLSSFPAGNSDLFSPRMIPTFFALHHHDKSEHRVSLPFEVKHPAFNDNSYFHFQRELEILFHWVVSMNMIYAIFICY